MTVTTGKRRLVHCVLAAGVAACETDTPASLTVAWSRAITPPSATVWPGRPSIVQQTVYTQNVSHLEALDAATGSVRWRRALRSSGAINAQNILVVDDIVVTAGSDSVRAVDAASGSPRWAWLPDANVASCEIAASNGRVFIGSRTPAVTALSTGTGQPLWSTPLGAGWSHQAIVWGISVAGDTVYVAIDQFLSANGFLRTGHVVALNAVTGVELWRYTAPGDTTTANGFPTITPTSLLVGDFYGQSFFAIDRSTGQQRWRVETAAGYPGVSNRPVAHQGRAYAAAQGGVYAVDEQTGSIIWSRTDLLAASDLAICGEMLLVQAFSVTALDLMTGRTLATVLEPAGAENLTSALAVSGNRAFVVGLEASYGLVCN